MNLEKFFPFFISSWPLAISLLSFSSVCIAHTSSAYLPPRPPVGVAAPLAAIKPKLHYSNLTLFDTFTRNFDKADAIQLLSLFLNIPFAHVCHTCQTRKNKSPETTLSYCRLLNCVVPKLAFDHSVQTQSQIY